MVSLFTAIASASELYYKECFESFVLLSFDKYTSSNSIHASRYKIYIYIGVLNCSNIIPGSGINGGCFKCQSKGIQFRCCWKERRGSRTRWEIDIQRPRFRYKSVTAIVGASLTCCTSLYWVRAASNTLPISIIEGNEEGTILMNGTWCPLEQNMFYLIAQFAIRHETSPLKGITVEVERAFMILSARNVTCGQKGHEISESEFNCN